MIKTVRKLGRQGDFLVLIMSIHKNKSTAKIILNEERPNALPVRSGTRQGYLLSPLLYDIFLGVLASAVGKAGNKWHKDQREGGREEGKKKREYCPSLQIT